MPPPVGSQQPVWRSSVQSRKRSVQESLTNIVVGILLSWLTVWWVLTLPLTPGQAATLSTALCTVWSLIRSYTIRRIFNWIEFQ